MGKLTLTEAENIELLKRARAGDESAKEEFFKYNQRLARHIALKFDANTKASDGLITHDEIYGTAIVGLVKAYNTYDPEANAKFVTYASTCITNEVLMFLRRWRKANKYGIIVDHLDHIIAESTDRTHDGHDTTLMDIIPAPESEVYNELATSSALHTVINKFKEIANAVEYKVFYHRFIEEKNQYEIAQMCNYTQSYMSRIEKRVIKKLKKLALRYDLMEGDLDAMTAKVNVGQIKYAFENYSILSCNQIAKALGTSLPTVQKYKQIYDQTGLSNYTSDESAYELIVKYLANLTELEKRQLQNKIQREKQKQYEAPSEVKTYYIDPAPKKESEEQITQEEYKELAQELAQSDPSFVPDPEAILDEEQKLEDKLYKELTEGKSSSVLEFEEEEQFGKIELRLDNVSVDNIADLLETVMNQLKHEHRYDFGLVVYTAEKETK